MPVFKITLKVLLIVAVISAIFLAFFWKKTYPDRLVVNGKIFFVEVADNNALLEKGLSGHEPLGPNEGMFFVFQNPGRYGFWMKDMTFPIDIIWIDSNYRVVYIEKSVSPDTYPKIFYPSSPATYVLEVAAGISDKINLKIGDQVKFLEKGSENLVF